MQHVSETMAQTACQIRVGLPCEQFPHLYKGLVVYELLQQLLACEIRSHRTVNSTVQRRFHTATNLLQHVFAWMHTCSCLSIHGNTHQTTVPSHTVDTFSLVCTSAFLALLVLLQDPRSTQALSCAPCYAPSSMYTQC